MNSVILQPHYEGGLGVANGIAVVRIPEGTPIKEKKQALDKLRIVAKAHSTQSKVARTNWAKFHRERQAKLF